MRTAFLTLRDLRDDDPELHIELHAANGGTSITQDFYCFAEDLEQFGKELSSFPISLASEARLEIGRRSPEWAYFILVRAYVHDRQGHSALEIEVESYLAAPYGQSARFYILCDPGSLNRLGTQLVGWFQDRQAALEWHPSVS